MRSETQQTGRRRRGGRRHRGPRSSGGSQYAQSTRGAQGSSAAPASASKAPAKRGFFQRLLALFTGKPKRREVPGSVYGRVPAHDTARPVSPSPNGSSSSANGAGRSRVFEETEPARPKPARKLELLEVTSPKLYVGNLSFDATESDLSELFSGVGLVQSAEVVSHRESHKSKGFAFVTMSSLDEAKRAVTELHDKEFMSRRLVVSGAKTSDVRDARHVA